MVLDGVVCSPMKPPCDLFPFVADLSVGLEEGGFLSGLPGYFRDAGAQLVVPPL